MIQRTFEAAYLAQYGVNPSHVPIEIVSWRLTVADPTIAVGRRGRTAARAPEAPSEHRPLLLWPEAPAAPVYDRAEPGSGQTIAGPAIIEERETTIVMPPGWDATVECDRAASSPSGGREMDGIELEILWSNLISIVSEQAKALQRIAFSPIVREAGDLASGLFDARGRMVAQANTGTPGHINSLAAAGQTLAAHVRRQARPGRHRHHQRSLDVGGPFLRHHRASARSSGTSG